MELVDDARQERKTILSDMNSFLVNEIDNDYAYANVTKPFQKLKFRTMSNPFESDVEIDKQFNAQFPTFELKDKVQIRKFRENTR